MSFEGETLLLIPILGIKMPHRILSPPASDNEIDISGALANDDDNSSTDDEAQVQHPDRKARMLAPGEMPDLEGDYSSDDAGFIADIQAASMRKGAKLNGKIKSGGFQAMALSANLMKAIIRKGFSVPTPIQRKTVPLILDGQDVVGMARTGSGKTAAFVLPMIERLKNHSPKVGARGLILSPSRELALQTLKVIKDFSRGTDLKCVLLVGGESLEDQFSSIAENPDIVVATPGRFLHLKVEMGLDLSSIRYVVFDEADRLFEMGFAAQLTEILHALPQSRQTLLFSATLPKSLVEFARAGLQDPRLVRLDADSKISPDLESAFFTVKSQEKEGALLHILTDIIKIPTGQTERALQATEQANKNGRKRKREESDNVKAKGSPRKFSTIVFTATQHRVEYLATLLRQSGFSVSHAYSTLDQTARKIQVSNFTAGLTHIFVATDIAARGIDIPILANVVNYDFPAQPKIFVHRVGRTARAGQRGWSYSLCRDADAPYLLDFQLFLSKRLIGQDAVNPNYSQDVVIGSFRREQLERNSEWVSKLLDEDENLTGLRSVAVKAEKLYLKTRNAASSESARRSKEVTSSKDWMNLHPLFADNKTDAEMEQATMLARVSDFRPQETVFEIGKRGAGGEAAEIRKRRMIVENQRRKHEVLRHANTDETSRYAKGGDTENPRQPSPNKSDSSGPSANMDSASEDELEVTFSQAKLTPNDTFSDFKHSEFFMSYNPSTTNLAEDRSYGVHSGGNSFLSAAKSAAMDLTNDDGEKGFAEPSRAKGMRWDKKSKKYVARANDEDGSRGKHMIRGESGQKIAASFRSGRFDAWRKSNRIDRLPRTGEKETAINSTNRSSSTRFKHKAETAPKEADKYRDDFHKRRKMVEKAKVERRGRFKEGGGKHEIKGIDDVRKERSLKERRKMKNARPGRKK